MKKRRLILPLKYHFLRPLQGCHVQTGFPSLWKTVSYWSKPRQSGGQSTGCTWEAEGYGLVKKRRVRETILLSAVLKWESPKNAKADPSQKRVMTGQETTGKTLSTGSFSHCEGGWHWHMYPEKIWYLCPQKCSELALSNLLQLDLLWAGGGTGWPLDVPFKLNSVTV